MISRVTRLIGTVVLTIVIAITLAACGAESVEVPGETVVVEKEVIKEVQVPGETVVVEKVVTEIVEVPGETVTVEVVKEVQVPGETVAPVEKEVVDRQPVRLMRCRCPATPEVGGVHEVSGRVRWAAAVHNLDVCRAIHHHREESTTARRRYIP